MVTKVTIKSLTLGKRWDHKTASLLLIDLLFMTFSEVKDVISVEIVII